MPLDRAQRRHGVESEAAVQSISVDGPLDTIDKVGRCAYAFLMKDRDIEIARQFADRRRARRQEHLDGRLEEARRDFDRIVEKLIRDYRSLRIYQWGSLLHGDHFSEISDIDIAVEGFSDPPAGLHAAAEAERLTTFPVDLVKLERIHPAPAESIRQKGRLVYKRP